jgi:hypothetical protein
VQLYIDATGALKQSLPLLPVGLSSGPHPLASRDNGLSVLSIDHSLCHRESISITDKASEVSNTLALPVKRFVYRCMYSLYVRMQPRSAESGLIVRLLRRVWRLFPASIRKRFYNSNK